MTKIGTRLDIYGRELRAAAIRERIYRWLGKHKNR